MRDSASSLRFDRVVVRGSTGAIGMAQCPGAAQLKTDLEAAAAAGTAAVVTLLEAEEFQQLSVPAAAFSEGCAELGMEWHHLPIKDQSAPGQLFEECWSYSGLRLRQHLREGRSILVHCRGGLGRTGTVAARLLIEFGTAPDEAIAAVRQARPGTIETPAQEEYVQACRAVDESKESMRARVAGCLLGGAAGDAFGYPVEFKKLPAIRARYGRQGLQVPQFRAGQLVVSDCTQMTLFTLEGLLRGFRSGNPVEEIRLAYLDWLETQGYGSRNRRRSGSLVAEACLRVERDPGTTCVSAFHAEKPANRSKGCGGIMRVAPIGLFPNRLDAEQSFRLAAQCAALTHGHPSGHLCAGVVAAIVRELMDGMDLRPAIEGSLKLLKQYRGHEEIAAALEPALGSARKVQDLGVGWVAEESLAIALYSALNGGSFSAVLALAANQDGNSGAAASTAGQIWGAWKGVSEIPHPWIAAVDVLHPLLGLLWKTSASRYSTASRSS